MICHSHILLHPCNETSWNDQVLGERVARKKESFRVALAAGLLADLIAVAGGRGKHRRFAPGADGDEGR